jgi:plastocyanin
MRKSYLPLVAIILLAAIFYFSVMVVLVFNIQPPLTHSSSVSGKTPTVSIVLYEGEISNSQYGFGFSPTNLTSPGPTLRFSTSDVVNITVVNVGQMPHAFAITNVAATGAKVLFGAQIGSASNPLLHDQHGTVIFTPNNAGSSFYYICPVPGHVSLGMYGSVVITSG